MLKKNFQPYAFLFYLACLLLIGLVVRDIDGQPNILATIQNFMSPPGVIQLGDPHSFSSGAIDVYQNGWFTPDKQWLINLWPPGFMLLEAAILKLFGLDAPFIAILIALCALLGAGMLVLMRKYLLEFVAPALATFLPLLPFCFPVTRLFLLQPIGIVLGECFSIIFFITAVLLALLGFRERSYRKAIAAGLMLALSAYFRSQFEILVMFLTLGAIPVLLWCLIGPLLRRTSQTGMARPQARLVVWIILSTLITAHLLMFPWRLRNLNNPYNQRLNWVSTETITYSNAGLTDEELFKVKAGWIVEGGGNLACNLEASYCGKGDKTLYYKAFFKHIKEWYIRKFALLDKYWFASIYNFTAPVHPSSWGDNVANLLLLLCVLLTWPFLWIARRHSESVLHLWICGSFYSCLFAVFTFVQFEVRYFYLIKIFSMFSTIMLGCLAFHARKLKLGQHKRSESLASLKSDHAGVPTPGV